VVEVHFGEGGSDSKDFVVDLASAYLKYAKNLSLQSCIEDSSDGHFILRFSGIGVGKAFRNESGVHVVQRCPKSGGGKKHTSVVSVAVLPLPPEKEFIPLPYNELDIITQCGSGKGGQNQNKVASAVRMRHIPTGLSVFINGRDQGQNKKSALRILTAKVNEFKHNAVQSQYDEQRRSMVRTGRGSKKRTYDFIRSQVRDHETDKKTSKIDLVMKGRFDLLA
jgi:peptide chain release factor 1